MKKINTEFGEMEISPDDVIHFEQGLPGFDDVKDYVLINHDEQGMIMTMQTVDGEVPQFVVLDPYAIVEKYEPKLPAYADDLFGGKNINELHFLVIAVVKENYLDTVVNLKSPIVIDPSTRNAAQIILENTDYSLQHKVFSPKEGSKC